MTESRVSLAVRRMRAGELDAACEVIGQAFADNPNTLALVGGDRAAAQRLMRTTTRVAKMGRRWSHVLIAEASGAVVGVLNAAEWPHCQMGVGEKLRTAPALIRALGLSLPRALTLTGVWARHDPKEPHWHIGPIGVRPEYQGTGVGGALLTAFLTLVDGQRLPAYLETDVDRNVRLYERFGFRVIEAEQIVGVSNRFMWRAPPISRTADTSP